MAQEKQHNHPSVAQRKKILKDELKRLENQMESDFGGIRSDMDTYLNPKEFIKKHPMGSVGVSLLMGFLLSKGRRRGKVENPVTYLDMNGGDMSAAPAKPAGPQNGITSLVWGELKKIMARKGTEWAMHLLEEKVKEFNRQREEQQQEGDR